MKTAWSEFIDWTHARREAERTAEEANLARKKCNEVEARITALLQQHGPVVHDGHVYALHNDQIACEACIDSYQLKLEEHA